MSFSDDSDYYYGDQQNLHRAESLMNSGFAAKEHRQYDDALLAFSHALQVHPNDGPAIPYLIIEIAGILKLKGHYDDAITLFTNGLRMPILLRNPALQREFINTIAYLRITRNTLYEKRLGLLPFPLIPAEIVSEIDTKFNEWSRLEEAI